MARLLLAAALGVLCGASTCDNQDFSGRYVVPLEEGSGEALRAYRQPYIGRLTLDFGLLNTGAVPATYQIAVQAQTTGATDADACENATAVPRLLDAVALDADGAPVDVDALPVLRTLDRPHEITLPATDDGFGGAVTLRVQRESAYRVYTARPETRVAITADGLDIPESDVRAALTTCDEVDGARTFPLDEGTYLLTVTSPEALVTLQVEEACSSVRTVPATCAGAASSVYLRDPLALTPGSFVSGRISSADLGVGDQAVVSVECEPADTCGGELELFFLIEQLECRTDSDCRAREACSSDAYCVPLDGARCASAGDASGWTSALGLFALLWLRRRRRHA